MPTYNYRYADEPEGPTFELIHRMAEAPLARHPETGRPIKLVYVPIGLTLQQGAMRSNLTEAKLAASGFQRWVRQRDGSYVRTVGNLGPATISKQTAVAA